ncbi:MAG: GH92 family glycosyl hydrolase, partial [Myxococcota bacterium]
MTPVLAALPVLAELVACRDPEGPASEPVRAPYDPIDYVDPTIGTGGVGAQTTGVGPHAAVPFGMTLVGPDTRDANGGVPAFYHYGGYHRDDVSIDGFSHTHAHGMGVNDFCGVNVMPRGQGWSAAFTEELGRTAPFRHDTEQAAPGSYAVTLDDDGTRVEIAATAHGAIHRYTFAPDRGPNGPVVVVDLGHTVGGVAIGDDSTIRIDGAEVTLFQRLLGGYSDRFGGLQTYAILSFDAAPSGSGPSGSGAWSDPAAPVDGAVDGAGATAGLYVTFPPGTETVELRVALSVVDLDGARANLAAELTGVPFEEVAGRATAAWASELDAVHLWGGPDEDAIRTTFHTAQYHTMLMPRTYRDVDGRYRGLDGEVHTADFAYLSDLSLWDTYRTVHPWFALVQPDRQREVLQSLVRMTEDGGSVPRWPLGHGYTGGMIGSPASIVFADSAAKGIDGWDEGVAFDAAYAQATGPVSPEGREGVEDWTTLGYVPSDVGAGASLTLEYAWADATTALWGRSLGRDAEADTLAALGRNWRNIWDPDAGFLRAKARDGSFAPFTSEFRWTSDYTEGNAWHYLWTVPYDVDGLIEVEHGGDREAFFARTADYWQEVFAEPDDAAPDDWYWHGNEPVLHYAWLGSLAGRTDLTVDAVRWILAHRYAPTPTGLDGNDDAGTLSAWYLWAATG